MPAGGELHAGAASKLTDRRSLRRRARAPSGIRGWCGRRATERAVSLPELKLAVAACEFWPPEHPAGVRMLRAPCARLFAPLEILPLCHPLSPTLVGAWRVAPDSLRQETGFTFGVVRSGSLDTRRDVLADDDVLDLDWSPASLTRLFTLLGVDETALRRALEGDELVNRDYRNYITGQAPVTMLEPAAVRAVSASLHAAAASQVCWDVGALRTFYAEAAARGLAVIQWWD